jgi:hypothetical protein
MPIPYIQIPLGINRLSSYIKEIIIGPCPHPRNSSRAIEMFLKKEDLTGVNVVPSKIPYRNW